MKNFTKTTLSLVAVMLLSLAFVQCKDAKDAAVTKFIELQIDQQNKLCPVNMGNGLTMEKCTSEGNKTIKFFFTISDALASQLTINDELKATFVNTLKTQPQFSQIKDFEISYIYAFSDTSKKDLGEIKITPEDYK